METTILDTEVGAHSEPMVFLFDFNSQVEDRLRDLRINFFSGSFGKKVNVQNKRTDEKYLKLNHDYPANLHEYDIVMLDLTKSSSEAYDPTKHQIINTPGNTAHALLSAYPEQTFNPRPLSINLISKDIAEICEKKSFVIAFIGKPEEATYKFVEITNYGAQMSGEEEYSSFNFYKHAPAYTLREGNKVSLPAKASKLNQLFEKHLGNITYHAIFKHPQSWANGSYENLDNFVPILQNERGEIISYAHFIEKSIVLVFPEIKESGEFVSELFKYYLPDIEPEIFPFHGEFKWIDSGDYPLPGEEELLTTRSELEQKFKEDITNNDSKLAKLKEEYKFLTELLTETGTTLVKSVEQYLRWLGFEKVLNMDDTNPDILEEDIQIDCTDKLLVIEVKGIGGTSTDKDCSQITKIKFRRAEERGKFDVFALYIVNHQRYMPPISRNNPPFFETQIKDAENDKRGLITTFQLYKAYFLIEEGILSKEKVRDSLFKFGLINLEPDDLKSIGNPTEFFMDGKVIILNLENTPIKVGDELIIKKKNSFSKTLIQSIQLNDENVTNAHTGEVGVKCNKKIKKNSEIFIKVLN